MDLFRVKLKLKAMKPTFSPKVTDHALVRFIERQHGMDIEAMKKAIVSPSVRMAALMGEGTVISDKVYIVVKDHTIVTCLPRVKDKKKAQRYREAAE